MRKALGLIETIGLAAAYQAADTALKTANVELIGYELSKGDGMVTVKISGNVGAVQAGIKSAQMAASLVSKVASCRVIPRPSQDLDKMIFSDENVLYETIEEKPGSVVDEVVDVVNKIVEEEPVENKVEDVNLIDQVSLNTEENIVVVESINEDVEKEVQLTVDELVSQNVDDNQVVTCNICKDPYCNRQKGQPKRYCLHYFKNE